MCKKIGHYAKMCNSSKKQSGVRGIKTGPGYVNFNDAFIGAVGSNQNDQRWAAVVSIKQIKPKFFADTQADVSVIPITLFNKHFRNIQLSKPEQILYGADNQQLNNVIGCFRENIHYHNKIAMADIYVIRGAERPLLAGKISEKLGIVKRADIDTVTEERMSFDPIKKFPKLFKGLGHVKTPYTIPLREGAVPHALTTPRTVPIPRLKKIKQKLDEMIKLNVIEKVEEPTDWCAGLVVVPKSNGDIRMCVDYIQLNQFVKREIYPMPVTENVLGRLEKAKYFTKLDANSGFWQFELDEASQLLTTFITPFGRFKYKRLPFGIAAAPEFFQKRISQILEGIDGAQVNSDDILVYGNTVVEHDERLTAVLKRFTDQGITLNVNKCIFCSKRVKYLGQVIDEEGIHVDEDRIKAIKAMAPPENPSEVRSLMGSINYLSRFIEQLAAKAKPLNDLLSPQNHFKWDIQQENAFKEIKEELIKSPALAWFDPNKETAIAADASSYAIGAELKQKDLNGGYRTVAYASKTLTKAQQNWAQIEKEGYALVWACERFKDFISGLEVMLETDHKPLVPIFMTKALDELTPKLQRMRLRITRYQYKVRHIPGKELGMADILSRRPMSDTGMDEDLEEQVNTYVRAVIKDLPASNRRLNQIIDMQRDDPICSQLINFSKHGWPNKKELKTDMVEYWQYQGDIAVNEGLLMKASRIIIPRELRRDILEKIHEGHQGIVKCRARAKDSVWWPGLSKELENVVKQCKICIQESKNRHEPLMPSKFPDRPWQKIATDLFHLEGKNYLLVTDLKESEIITKLKSIFARHGTPEIVYSDNGTHFNPVLTTAFRAFVCTHSCFETETANS